MNRSIDRRKFRQRPPPLSVTIKQILERYPDGQIFKEIIQNADDAEATKVQFYLDCRKHDTAGLVEPELKAYQGPALIATNDAVFSEQDWENIQRPMQSIKTDDPFKIGRFGIGFNSVYHITDVPSIISGDSIVYFEPQEKIWNGEGGMGFYLKDLLGSDYLNPLHGIADFNSQSTVNYNKTLFRFPLRSVASGISKNIYTIEKVLELLDALRSEAKLLLLFLRSLLSIEVYTIDEHGQRTLSFQTKIEDVSVQDLVNKRALLHDQLQPYHDSRQYDLPKVFKFTAKFDITVYDSKTEQTTTNSWFIANQVGSSNSTVAAAAVEQRLFPWVGTAVELENPGDGKIFCFLPVPVEMAFKLPVHINGTFSLNDDRRSLKWPGIDRKNDPAANWNEMLVRVALPSCYASLLLEARHLLGAHFYDAWPDVNHLEQTQLESLLRPIFDTIMTQDVILTEPQSLTCPNEWVKPDAAVCRRTSDTLMDVVKTSLAQCGVKLAELPPNVWGAFVYVNYSLTEVKPRFVRDALRSNPASYTSMDRPKKLKLLQYCFSDHDQDELIDLQNLELLPLANGAFTAFQSCLSSSKVYVCTSECPGFLLPNLSHRLVDLSDDSDLQTVVTSIVGSSTTQLRVLTAADVATLLDEAMPAHWRSLDVVSFPTPEFPSDWFETFWRWAYKYDNIQLSIFQNKLVLPVQCSAAPVEGQFNVVRLSKSQPILLISSNSECSSTMLSVLNKLGIQYCFQKDFKHPQLTQFIQLYSPNALLEAISLKGSHMSVTLTPEEAETLRKILAQSDCSRKDPLQDLRMFQSCVNTSTNLYSIKDVSQNVIVQPSNSIDLSVLPPDVVIFSSEDDYQTQLLKKLNYKITSGAGFLIKHIFPKILHMGAHHMDKIMLEVFKNYHMLYHQNESIKTFLHNLKFVSVASRERKCPHELFDPSDENIHHIFYGEDVFPCSPYDHDAHIDILRLCGLKTSISPQEILDVISSISLPASSHPLQMEEQKITCAKAVIEYINSYCDNLSCNDYVSFRRALFLLSSHRSWMPVLAERPADYPACLPWKGSGNMSHVISFSESTCTDPGTLSVLYGSQAYFIEALNGVPVEAPKHLLVAHFQQLMAYKDEIKRTEMTRSVCEMYRVMLEMVRSVENLHHLDALKSLKEWVYMHVKEQNTFMNIEFVAQKHNPDFHYSIEPYICILPDTVSEFSELFKHFGMNDTISLAQIVAVLRLIREEVQCKILRSDGASATLDHKPEVETAWDVVMNILNWLTERKSSELGNEIDSVLVPAESTSDWPDLRDPSDLVYADNDFLKNYASSSDHQLTFVHSRVSQKVIKYLNVVPLTKKLNISPDCIEDAEQHESLISRLNNILDNYTSSLAMIKELVQNADDAKATEVNICFDTRHHTTERKTLFFPDMCSCHGPALVVHNNSTFSDSDFANIQKLAGATKQNDHLKIGKFGIGFCSVYHITDVPSFVSRERLYIFDPTKKHLGTQLGISVNYRMDVIKHSNQMDPYEGLFGFSTTPAEPDYEGTMFRLPFRTCHSDLKGMCYPEPELAEREFIKSIKRCGDKLLLFLQHVRHFTIQKIETGRDSPKILYEIHKSPSESLSFDKASLTLINSRYSRDNTESSNNWMISKYATALQEKAAVASVACQLSTTDSTYTINDLEGEIFCFLPLCQFNGKLPVHVNCNFDVTNDRQGILISQESTLVSDAEMHRNVCLMEQVIPVAYIKLLETLKEIQEKGFLQGYIFHSLWPLGSDLANKDPWTSFLDSFYTMIQSKKLFYSESTHKWLTLQESRFLKSQIFGQPDYLPCFVRVIHHLRHPLVDLPISYSSHFNLSDNLLAESEYVDIFFREILKLEMIKDERNDLLEFMLKIFADKKNNLYAILKQKFDTCVCIPCGSDGNVLRKCSEVIYPEAKFAALFDKPDRFPIEAIANCHALVQAGAKYDTLPWEFVLERAQTVAGLMKTNSTKALERVELILTTISNHVSGEPPEDEPTIDSIPFLPVMKRPEGYPLDWYGESHRLCSGRQLILSSCNDVMIAGSQVAFVCEDKPEDGGCGSISPQCKAVLHLKESPSLCEVIAHLKEVVRQVSSSNPPQSGWISETCEAVYKFIDRSLRQSNDENVDLNVLQLQEIDCIWNGSKFLNSSCVANDWKLKNGPYLYTTPPEVSLCKEMSSVLDIKSAFSLTDAQGALEMMKSDFNDQPIDDDCMELFGELIPIIQKSSGSEEIKQLGGVWYLPDTQRVLRNSTNLVYNDAPWMSIDEKYIFVNEMVNRYLAIDLGVKPVRSKLLGFYASKKVQYFRSIKFGQKEPLTTRINNIIKDYPFNETILKELLQNADDAKARKMYIILDRRTHGCQSVLSTEWKELQGPALLIWNDSTFTEKDLEGIQELGLGGKQSDSDSIGQFGIGFNVVYHLTDCPSFMTNGDTLCILDPHCRYVPEAIPDSPGGMYGDLKAGFWRDFSDMSSAYLQDGHVANLPSELLGGSLFRFPIRHTETRSQESLDSPMTSDGDPISINLDFSPAEDSSTRVAANSVDSTPPTSESSFISKINSKPLTVDELAGSLEEWMPLMKQAMLFLNSVSEIKYLVIDHCSGDLQTKFHYKTEVSKPFTAGCDCTADLRCNSNSQVVMYPLSIGEYGCDEPGQLEEKWLIQQGIGDISTEEPLKFLGKIKPKHGIAASLDLPGPGEFIGRLFCFLPLPATTDLPVHINGNFALSSSRRSLRIPDEKKDCWNAYIFKALASSYASFLIKARDYYINPSSKNWEEALSNYYRLFPTFAASTTEKDLDCFTDHKQLACNVYKILLESNAEVLCGISFEESQLVVKWYPLISPKQADQAYFWSDTSESIRKIIQPILESIGLKITPIPLNIMDCFNSVIGKYTSGTEDPSPFRKIPCISPRSVFEYYTNYSKFLSSCDMEPCHISETVFHDAETYQTFIKFLVEDLHVDPPEQSDRTPPIESDTSTRSFPDQPFSHFLLLAADGYLTVFDKENKILNSKYSHLFPKNLDKFLHPALRCIHLDSSYFIDSDDADDAEKERILDLILSIFDRCFPSTMKCSMISNEPTVIEPEKLRSYWECFENDTVFTRLRDDFLKHWAFLLTTDKRLVSTSNKVLPAYRPSSESATLTGARESSPQAADTKKQPTSPSHQGLSLGTAAGVTTGSAPPPKLHDPIPPEQTPEVSEPEILNKICEIMQSLHMPFLDTTVVHTEEAVTDCPDLSNRDHILTNFCHTHFTASEIGDSNIDVLLDYFSDQVKPSDPEWVQQVRSLPLFKDVLGNYLRIPMHDADAYIWPDVITVGYNSWVPRAVVFVEADGKWTRLGSDKQLSIKTISAEQLYTKFIFPNFARLSEADQYDHLQHIRDHMYETNLNFTKTNFSASSSTKQKIRDAKRFISDLKTLKCIRPDPDSSTLQPVSSFCDHKVSIFKVLSCGFKSLPKQLQSDEWLNYFKKLGLKETLTMREYLELCKKTAASEVDDVAESSKALLRYLFSKSILKCWSDEKMFLRSVSNIPFALAADTSSVEWILRGDYQANQLVKLNGAGSYSLRNRLWTVKPLVRLPEGCTLPDSVTKTMLNNLNITYRASVDDVVSNIRNIAWYSPYANENLFNKYPSHLLPEKDSARLLYVMYDNFSFLHNYVGNSLIESLANFQCIPVYCDPSKQGDKMVLVKPSCVLYGVAVGDYHPHLHQLPEYLEDQKYVLSAVGVGNCLSLQHMQLVLEKIFKDSRCRSLDLHAKECVKKALMELKNLLKYRSQNVDESSLAPLYLPDTSDELKLSTEMLYADTPSYFGDLQLSLEGTEYSYFDITDSDTSYNLDAHELCQFLPEIVRPLGMSKCCQHVLEDCEETIELSDFSHRIRNSVCSNSDPLAIVKIFNKFLPNKTSEETLNGIVTKFLSSLSVVTIHNLKTQIILRKSNVAIGHMKSEFYLDCDDAKTMLYIDHDCDDDDDVVAEIAAHLYSILSSQAEIFNKELLSDMKAKFLQSTAKYLKAESAAKKHKALVKCRVEVSGDYCETAKHTLELGEEIPVRCHYQLDRDSSNVFHPEEYVGYEDSPGSIKVAQVIQVMESNSDNKLDRMCHISTAAKTDSDVKVCELYKLRPGMMECLQNKLDPKEGSRWVKQADVDYRVLCDIHAKARSSSSYSHVCFMAHQVAEKALKGGVYAICGMGLRSHRLCTLSYALHKSMPDKPSLAEELVRKLDGYYDGTRYPDCWSEGIPSDHYSQGDADEASTNAKAVLDIVKSIMPH